MDNFEAIRNIWLSVDSAKMPTSTDINRAIKDFEVMKRRKIVALIILSIVCISTMFWVIYDYDSQLLTTRIGESLMLFLGFYLVAKKTSLLQKSIENETLSTIDFLDQLKLTTKLNAQNESKPIPFLISIVALGLYLYEILTASNEYLIFGYLSLFIFSIIIWFVYRPYMISRNLKKIESLMNKIETIKGQSYEK